MARKCTGGITSLAKGATAIWDWLFQTAYLPDKKKAREYGLKTPYPSTLLQSVYLLQCDGIGWIKWHSDGTIRVQDAA